MFMGIKQHKSDDIAESGFVLVLAMVILLMVSLFGIWALQTSTSELQVAGGSQHLEAQFNITEGSSYSEAGKVGFTLEPRYAISNPDDFLKSLLPPTDADSGPGDFDPGGDTDTGPSAAVVADQVDTWPWENMLQDYDQPSTNNRYDYRYLTTYLHYDTPPMGYDSNFFRAYKFRIQTAATDRPLYIELGGSKIGPK